MPATLVLSPTYNERDNVRPLAEGVLAACPETHILFLDDASPDGTGAVIDEMAARDPRILVLHRAGKQGLGRAYLAGFAWALEHGYERIVTMDADLSHQPSALPALLDGLDRADVVVGSRYIGGIRVMNWPLSRLMLSKSAALYVRVVTGLPTTDPTGGFIAYRREVLQSLPLDRVEANGYSFLVEMKHSAWQAGFRIVEVPITFMDRTNGVSKMSGAIIREAIRVVWKLLFRNGLRRRPPAQPHALSVAAGARAT
jgi:dolichol-phosphate mannosyltransferase